MRNPDERVYLQHILDGCARVERFLSGVSQGTFERDEQLQSAVVYQIQTIGEAVRRLSPELRQRYPMIPWQDIAGVQRKLAHDYFSLDLTAIWLTATRDVPELRLAITRILEDLNQ